MQSPAAREKASPSPHKAHEEFFSKPKPPSTRKIERKKRNKRKKKQNLMYYLKRKTAIEKVGCPRDMD